MSQRHLVKEEERIWTLDYPPTQMTSCPSYWPRTNVKILQELITTFPSTFGASFASFSCLHFSPLSPQQIINLAVIELLPNPLLFI